LPFAEQKIINAIINNEWRAGETLLPERELAQILGITRPTLREALQRLARDGWITIAHGKSSIINDYKNTGGLGVLKSLVKISQSVPDTLINDWLEFRILIFPDLALQATTKNPERIISVLQNLPDLETPSTQFAFFDWNLQILIIHTSENSIAKMLYNDLAAIYTIESTKYFKNKETKKASLFYYTELKKAIINKQNIKETVKIAMQESLELWKKLKV